MKQPTTTMETHLLQETPSPSSESRTTQSTPISSDDELTEEERVEYEKGILTWGKVRNWRFWIRKEWIWYYLAFVLIVVVVALMAFFHKSVSTPPPLKMVEWLADGLDHRLVNTLRAEVARTEIRLAYPGGYPVCVVVPAIVRE